MLESWKLVDTSVIKTELAKEESLFSIGNGYLGMRGFYPERRPAYHPGVFINGFYELTPIHYGEHAYGLAEFNQTMLDLPDCRYIRIKVGEHFFDQTTGSVENYRRVLDFRKGLLTREMTWISPDNKRVSLKWESFISYEFKHIGGIQLSIKTHDPVEIRVYSTIALPSERPRDEYDPRVSSKLMRPPLEKVAHQIDQAEGRYSMQGMFRTIQSRLSLFCGMVHESSGADQEAVEHREDSSLPVIVYTIEGSKPAEFSCRKFFSYHSEMVEREHSLQFSFKKDLKTINSRSWEDFLELQENHLSDFWKIANIEIDGDAELQEALRFNLFQLYQSTGKDGSGSLAAKGLTGGGYEGHYFWDTEIYAMPLFTYTKPEIARALLLYRFSILPKARDRAVVLSQKGALYPWRTINGLEASAYYPAGTAQYHINADIAYSLITYIESTGDYSILIAGGAEMLFETARLWADLGFYNPGKGGAFCINEVTGPDEYSALVNNNYYTNQMAKFHLEKAWETAEWLKEHEPGFWEELCVRINLEDGEPGSWKKAADAMYIPFAAAKAIHPQDDQFMEREPWDFENRPKDKYPLLLYYHPLVIYRYRVLKQADAILGNFLLGNRIPWYQKKRDFEFYEPLTTGDSSLSACIQGIQAFEFGYEDAGLKHLYGTTLMDIEDRHGNSKDGLHTAAMAGSWMSIVFGIAGMRTNRGLPCFRPQLPKAWKSLTFGLSLQEKPLKITISRSGCRYQLLEEGHLQICHRSEILDVTEKGIEVPAAPVCKAVVFDLDGVITSTDSFHYRAWKRLADEHAWEFNWEINAALRGVSRRESLEIILRHNGVQLDDETIEELMTEKNTAYRDSLMQLTEKDVLPGIVPLLQELKEAGIKIALASASRNAPFILKRLKLEEAFDFVSPAGDVMKGKPDPEVFVRAAEGVGCLPEECIGVEDAKAGIEAVRSACMKSVGVGESVRDMELDLWLEDFTETGWSELKKLFE
ncbi:MAG: beta-phosphoglucomutase [Spirochaetales bacterium]|nr:beta-phosphoglucomutase [Spirochaetales bacterium]